MWNHNISYSINHFKTFPMMSELLLVYVDVVLIWLANGKPVYNEIFIRNNAASAHTARQKTQETANDMETDRLANKYSSHRRGTSCPVQHVPAQSETRTTSFHDGLKKTRDTDVDIFPCMCLCSHTIRHQYIMHSEVTLMLYSVCWMLYS